MLALVKRPRSPFWVIRGSIKGRRYEETTGTAERALAEEIRAKREAELFREAIYGRSAPASTSFAQAALAYVEEGGAKRFLRPVAEHFAETPLAKIDQDAIERGARRVYPQASAATRNRQFFTPASAVLHFAARRGWVSQPIIARPNVAAAPFRWLTPEEAERLIAASSPHLRPLVVFMLYTGARSGEALALDWRDLSLGRAHVTFTKTKNGEARGVPLHRRVVAELANLPHREGPVFRRPDGLAYVGPKGADDTSAGSRIKKAFRGAVRRAGLVNVSPHDLRHTFATWHYQGNRDLTALQKLGGWKSVAMVLRYAHVNVGELAASIDRLPSGFEASQVGGLLGDSDSEADGLAG
jgi:integrase